MGLLKARLNIYLLHVIVWAIMFFLIIRSEEQNLILMLITLLGLTMVCRFWDVSTKENLDEEVKE